ncbi:MAG: hypothetical protein BWK75_00735 [Candidatus Altiarchaeales archaeon A3]|nr:MAG: hypothetical protein BWK75_00735 [Candidatus Altiarchaeales archaeon A3]
MTRHKVFISYYHEDDEEYRNKFENLFGHLFINKSVNEGDINTERSTEYIKRIIQKGYISDTSVLVVLVSPKTYCRKHVDWEISAALMKKVGGYSGLLGICLPNHPAYGKDGDYNPPNIVPPRLVDNLESGYAKFHDWTENTNKIKRWIEDAFNAKTNSSHLINNNRPQFKNNRGK